MSPFKHPDNGTLQVAFRHTACLRNVSPTNGVSARKSFKYHKWAVFTPGVTEYKCQDMEKLPEANAGFQSSSLNTWALSCFHNSTAETMQRSASDTDEWAFFW